MSATVAHRSAQISTTVICTLADDSDDAAVADGRGVALAKKFGTTRVRPFFVAWNGGDRAPDYQFVRNWAKVCVRQ